MKKPKSDRFDFIDRILIVSMFFLAHFLIYWVARDLDKCEGQLRALAAKHIELEETFSAYATKGFEDVMQKDQRVKL